MVEEIIKKYGSLCKNYSLPGYDSINNEFEISSLDDEEFLLRNILRKVAEKLEFYCGILSEVLQPDTSSLSSMHETRFFMDDEKTRMYALYKKMMKSYRKIISLVLQSDESLQASFLKEFYVEWKNTKQELVYYLEKMEGSWEKETKMEEDLGYFG